MNIDLDTLKWSELKSQIHQRWTKLTDEDLSSLTGNGETDDFVALLRKRYGYGKVQAEIEIIHWLDGLDARARKIKK